MVARLLVVSDTHLAPGHGTAQRNWDAVVASVADSDADVVVHLGDLTVDGANRPEELEYARAELDRLGRPCFVVPGNHDIGDNPVAGAPSGETVIDDERRRRWLDTFGLDWWRLDLDHWTLLALDAQLFGSGLAAEAVQWSWLAAQVSDVADGQFLGLVVHKPLLGTEAELATAPSYRFVAPGPRGRLLDALQGRSPQLILSGHVHQHRILDLHGIRHVWAPTTWATLPDKTQPRYGFKCCGHLRLALDSGPVASIDLVVAPGVNQQVIGDTVASPSPAPNR
ncbi:MAG: metallophosphoesterase [Acidimicrobiales bacterium]